MRTITLIAVMVAALLATACEATADDSADDNAATETASTATTEAAAEWKPIAITGSGNHDSETFSVPADQWSLCLTLDEWQELSDGSAIGFASVSLHRDSDDRSVSNITADAEDPEAREACTTVRSDAGDFYVKVIAGTGLKWTVTAAPAE